MPGDNYTSLRTEFGVFAKDDQTDMKTGKCPKARGNSKFMMGPCGSWKDLYCIQYILVPKPIVEPERVIVVQLDVCLDG